MASGDDAHRTGENMDFKTLSRRQRKNQRRTWAGFFVAVTLRLTVWYAIITAVFRCPSSREQLKPSSPRVCRPYLQVKDLVFPYVSPYYDEYAAGYVDAAMPYVNTFQTRVSNPVLRQVEHVYVNYAAPRIVTAVDFAGKQWEKNGLPYVDDAQTKAWELYEQRLGPHVTKASKLVDPYVGAVRDTATEQYHHTIVPLYKQSRPYLERAYNEGQQLMVLHVLPYSRKIGEVSYLFLATRIWPRLRLVYGENVEPQLARIRERLTNYREEKKLKSMAEAAESSASNIVTSAQEPLSSLSSVASSVIAAVTDVIQQSASSVESVVTEEPTLAVHDKEKLASELRAWQDRFTKTSDKAADDLSDRIGEIFKEQTESQVNGVGKVLLKDLDKAVKMQLAKLKGVINHAISDLSEDATEADLRKAHEQAVEQIRKSGKVIKDNAQHLRSWKLKYIDNTNSLIQSATDSTLKVVDGIRNLGLQDIGMKWASMDEVSYTDWSNYHAEKTLDQWKAKIRNVAAEHPALSDVSREAEELEDSAMGIAEDAAKELARLKDVAAWKIEARDSTTDFSSRDLTLGVRRLFEKVKDTASSASAYVAGASPVADAQAAVSEATSVDVAEGASSVSSQASNSISSLSSSIESVAFEGASSVSSAASSASSHASGIVSQGTSVVSSAASSHLGLADALIQDRLHGADPKELASSLIDSSLGSASSALASAMANAGSQMGPAIASQFSASVGARASVSAVASAAAVEDIVSSVESAASEAGAHGDSPAASTLSSSLDSILSKASEAVDMPVASSLSSSASASLDAGSSSASSLASSLSSQAGSASPLSSASLAASSISSLASSASSIASDSASSLASPLSSAASSLASSASSIADPSSFRSAAALNLRSRAHSMASSLISSAQSAASAASLATPGPDASQISINAVQKAEAAGARFVAAANEFAKKDPAELTRMYLGGDADEVVSSTLAQAAAEITGAGEAVVQSVESVVESASSVVVGHDEI